MTDKIHSRINGLGEPPQMFSSSLKSERLWVGSLRRRNCDEKIIAD